MSSPQRAAGRSIVQRALSSLWFVPVVCVLAGMAVSFATIAIDRANDHDLIPPEWFGGADAAIAILSTIAASMVSLAALVLTITMVVVQLAMGQFSPRIVQTFLQDKPSQFAIGLFVATFAHAMFTLREVSVGPPEVVPGVGIVVAYLLVLISIVVLVLYVNHIGRSLRVSALIELVGIDTRRLLDEQYPVTDEQRAVDRSDSPLIGAPKSGVVCGIDHERLVDAARAADCVLRMVPALGQFVPSDAPLFEIEGDARRLDRGEVTASVALALERTLDQDIAYGLRLLVDIAERSISESAFLDPSTAVQAIDRIHDCLRQLADRPFPDGLHHDGDGVLRLVTPVMTWDAYVQLAFEEVRMAGGRSPQVVRRLTAALEDLLDVAPPERKAPLAHQLAMLQAQARGEAGDLTIDLVSDGLGIGPAADGGPVTSASPDAEPAETPTWR
jgi:uncharacterized membrane protein